MRTILCVLLLIAFVLSIVLMLSNLYVDSFHFEPVTRPFFYDPDKPPGERYFYIP